MSEIHIVTSGVVFHSPAVSPALPSQGQPIAVSRPTAAPAVAHGTTPSGVTINSPA